MSGDEPSFAELYTLGVPVALLARKYGITESSVVYRAQKSGAYRLHGQQRVEADRQRRHERIKANIALYPSKSMFDWSDRSGPEVA